MFYRTIYHQFSQALLDSFPWENFFDFDNREHKKFLDKFFEKEFFPDDQHIYIVYQSGVLELPENAIAIVWFSDNYMHKTTNIEVFAVHQDFRQKGIARDHLQPIIHEKLLRHIAGFCRPLFAVLPQSMRAAWQFLDSMMVPIGECFYNDTKCVVLGPPLGWLADGSNGPEKPPFIQENHHKPIFSKEKKARTHQLFQEKPKRIVGRSPLR